jgi:hypothetical protein
VIWPRVLFALTLLVSLAAGFMALYARDVRRARGATRFFAFLAAAGALATMAIGWVWL